MRNAVFTFGKFRLFHNGHMKIVNEGLAKRSGTDPFYLFVSPSKKIDVPLDVRVKAVRSLEIPDVYNPPPVPTLYAAAKYLMDCGYDTLTCVVGEDRYADFEKHLGALGLPIDFHVVSRNDSNSSSRLMNLDSKAVTVSSPLSLEIIGEIQYAASQQGNTDSDT